MECLVKTNKDSVSRVMMATKIITKAHVFIIIMGQDKKKHERNRKDVSQEIKKTTRISCIRTCIYEIIKLL